MNVPKYTLKAEADLTIFEFISEGAKRNNNKIDCLYRNEFKRLL